MGQPWDYIAKVICLGDSGTGKSSVCRYLSAKGIEICTDYCRHAGGFKLTIRLCEGRFSKTDVTIGVELDSRVVEVDDGKKIKLQIWDTAGQEQYRSVTNSYIRNATGALLVYDITRKETLSHVQHWLSDIKSLGEPHISIVLVGNKCDLSDRRQVSSSEAELWAHENGIKFHVETSAKTGESVERAFVEVAREIYRNIRDGAYDPRSKSTGIKANSTRLVNLGSDSPLVISESLRHALNQNKQTRTNAKSPSHHQLLTVFDPTTTTVHFSRVSGLSKNALHALAMFSEYASRFLAKSNLREGARHSQYPTSNAPLFFSAADYPTDDREHDQEVSAIYALQKSRRNLYYSADQDDDERNGSDAGSVNDGIRSSWNPGHSSSSDLTETAGCHNMVDVSLGEGSLAKRPNEDVPLSPESRIDSYSEASRHAEDPIQPPIQKFRPQNFKSTQTFPHSAASPIIMPYSNHRVGEHGGPAEYGSDPSTPKPKNSGGRDSSPLTTIPQSVELPPLVPPLHDRIWTKIYGGMMAFMFSTAFVVWLHTEEPKGSPIGDSIYSVLQKALPLLAVDTIITIFVALAWMLCLKHFIRPLLYLLVISVPIVMLCLTIYPLVTSLNGPWGGKSIQDHVMRTMSLFPLCLAFFWVYLLYRGRLALHKATSILQLALTIFAENPALLFCGFFALIATISFSWLWIFLVIRVFLNGRSTIISGRQVWQMDGTGWALGVFFVCMYLWTLGVLSHLQRVTISATVSHWYFYRKSTGTFSPTATFYVATHHALTTMFGSVCFSSFVALMIRLPLLVLPSRIGSLVHLLCFNFVASPIVAFSDPLAVTYGAIHSLPLIRASREINQLGFISNIIGRKDSHARSAYRLAKLLLTAARWMTSLALGIGAWIRTAHVADGGSLYGYVVGLLAGSIGWAILGTAERSLANIVDACLICTASDDSAGRYCYDAQMAFEGF
ncbi:hypothetical protein ABW20_dc0109207 [Dactylellina cionopaga]|nr:hypothetical protein ABW20_dc0109207 [Dactylellina cionopaga]